MERGRCRRADGVNCQRSGMTKHGCDFKLNRPGALIAALPAVLGFVPEHSLVLAAVDDGALGPVMRIDLADDLVDRVDQLVEVAAAATTEAVIAVIVDAEGARCPVCNREHLALCEALVSALDRHGIDLWAAHVVDRVAAGGRWHCADGCGAGGAVDDPAASPLAVAAVLDGRRLYPRRADLQAVVAIGDPDRCRRITTAIDEHTAARRDHPDGRRRHDVENVLAAAARNADGQLLTDTDLAPLACALVDVQVRDTLYALAVGEIAGAAESLWAMLSQTLPEPSRVEALVLLAFSAYVRGDGALAGVALEAALRCHPGHRMAGMLDTALQSGLHPEKIRDLAVTGYRLADQLGVRLPPRRSFGQRAG